MIKTIKPAVIFLLCLLTLLLGGCSFAQKQLDISGLKDLAAEITATPPAGTPEALRSFIAAASLAKNTEPASSVYFSISQLAKWHLEHPSGEKLIMEKISFPSGIKQRDGFDKAVFYIYRTGELKDKKIVLWVPGAGVSDFAFRFIKHFFTEALLRHYNIVFYVPPYHLERTAAGQNNGEGFFTSDHERNISLLLNSVRELRTMISYLKGKGVSKIGGWGGSIGATMLLLTEQIEEFDHLNIMIPVVDFGTMIFKNSYLSEAVNFFARAGFSEKLLTQAYGIVNPVNYQLNMNPDRVQIMYAEYDLLTPKAAMVEFSEKRNIKRIIAYPRSHATILLTRSLYKDYGLFLDAVADER